MEYDRTTARERPRRALTLPVTPRICSWTATAQSHPPGSPARAGLAGNCKRGVGS
jgi:hypothetical protein